MDTPGLGQYLAGEAAELGIRSSGEKKKSLWVSTVGVETEKIVEKLGLMQHLTYKTWSSIQNNADP